MWIVKVLYFLLTAVCFVVLSFVARKMASRVHAASKEHGLAFFRDPDTRRILQILILVVFLIGLGLEGVGVPLGSGVNSFSWWKYLLLLGLAATLVSDLHGDLKEILGDITRSAKKIIKAIIPEKKISSDMPGTAGSYHGQPVQDPGMTSQQQAWTPQEVVDLSEFIDEGEDIDNGNDARLPIEDPEGMDVIAVAGENTGDEDMIDLSHFADMEVTEEATPNQQDEEDPVDLSHFADMEVTADDESNQADEEDAVDLDTEGKGPVE